MSYPAVLCHVSQCLFQLCSALQCTACTALLRPVLSHPPLRLSFLTCSQQVLITYAHMHNALSYNPIHSFPYVTSSTYVQAYAPLRPLVLVLKYFLTRKGLCEAFTGGLSSYALLLVTARFLQEVQDLSYLSYLSYILNINTYTGIVSSCALV